MSNILEARSISKSFGKFVAVRNVSISVAEGSVHALIGPNGAGKTTVFNLLTKALQPTFGQIWFRGTDITKASPADVAQQGLVRSFQISSVFPSMSVLDNVRLALQRRDPLARSFWRSRDGLKKFNQRALDLLDEVGLAHAASTNAAALSYGRKRALEIATTLAVEPDLLLLDEPLAGMGNEDTQRIANLIREISKRRTVLMVEHNLKVVESICDSVTVLQRGEILAEGSYASVSANVEVRAAYLGSDHD